MKYNTKPDDNGYPIALLIDRNKLKTLCKIYGIDMQRLLNRARASTERLTRKDIKELMKSKGQKF
jgi:ribosomal protein L12E/L44/L45/RPP1/RPP2